MRGEKPAQNGSFQSVGERNVMNDIMMKFFRSWNTSDDKEYEEILEWVRRRNSEVKVEIRKNRLSDSDFWFYSEQTGDIRNKNGSFFQIAGMQQFHGGNLAAEQPILIQNEIGYLGILCKEKNGVLYFLMQAKIEPGNVNKIQLSPTIQATKSNFTQKHGGKKPAYLEYFLNASPESVVVDQIQSEQSSRFLGKRNRNIIVVTEDDPEVLPSHRWMTLGTIKRLMKIDNLVNMDTRTVISCIPFSLGDYSEEQKDEVKAMFSDTAFFRSIMEQSDNSQFVEIFHYINNYKMLEGCDSRIVPLTELSSWNISDDEIVCRENYAFKVVFCDIEIEGREVTHWTQPLFEATGKAVFGLVAADVDGKRRFLVHAKHEAGCFDGIELAPTVQLEASIPPEEYSELDRRFFSLYEHGAKVLNDVILSEEGGRFYHEENRNIVLLVCPQDIGELPTGYFWADYNLLNRMVQYNNVLNIQLRNLLSILEM